ncbi:MAG: guanylate kinase [Candidatus Heteroscillospira sp.]|jgi:guanylate kinase
MKKSKGKLIVLSGPSGAGKSTVIGHLLERRDDISFSVSATTRAPRPGEQEGVNYYFKTREEFEAMIAGNAFLEHAEYAGNCYGTPRKPVEELLEAGRSVILDIEVQGAFQVKQAMPEAVLVFLAPPSMAELERRLRGRKTDTEEKIRIRLETARREYALAGKYAYIVINDIAETAAMELDAIITAEKCTAADRINFIAEE